MSPQALMQLREDLEIAKKNFDVNMANVKQALAHAAKVVEEEKKAWEYENRGKLILGKGISCEYPRCDKEAVLRFETEVERRNQLHEFVTDLCYDHKGYEEEIISHAFDPE